MVEDLPCPGVIDIDTRIVGTYPVIAPFIFTDRGDIANLHGLQTRETRYILVDTVLIRTDPHTAVICRIDDTKRIIADRRLIMFVIQELPPLFIIQVDDDQTVVIADQPEPVVVVDDEVPDHERSWQTFDTMGGTILIDVGIPAVLLLDIDISKSQHLTPVVLVLIDIETVLLVLRTAMFAHPLVGPFHLTRIAIETDQLTGIRCHDQFIALLGQCGDARRHILLFTVAYLDRGVFLRLGVIAIDGLFIVLDPDILFRVDVEPFNTTRDTQFGHLACGIAFKRLLDRIEDTVVHTLSHPEFAVRTLIDLVGVVITHGCRVTFIGIEHLHPVTVIAVQSVRCTNPHVSS